MLTCCLDESGTDNNSTVAVVGGVVVSHSQFFWIDDELRKVLSKHKLPYPLHMIDFGQHGKLGHLQEEDRRPFFEDLVKVINDNKSLSVASTLSSEKYTEAFKGTSEFSMYGASFVQLAMMNGVKSRQDGYTKPLAYLLDCGNRFRSDVVEAFHFLKSEETKYLLNLGTIAFDSDKVISPLQVADVVSWATRRKLAATLNIGFEPLAEIFDYKHFEVDYRSVSRLLGHSSFNLPQDEGSTFHAPFRL